MSLRLNMPLFLLWTGPIRILKGFTGATRSRPFSLFVKIRIFYFAAFFHGQSKKVVVYAVVMYLEIQIMWNFKFVLV
jgi:hypothetical protein